MTVTTWFLNAKSCPNHSLPAVKRFAKTVPQTGIPWECATVGLRIVSDVGERPCFGDHHIIYANKGGKVCAPRIFDPDTGMRSTDVEHNTAPRDCCSTPETSVSAVNGPPTSPVPTTYHSKHTVPSTQHGREPTAPPWCGTVAKTEHPTNDRCRPCLECWTRPLRRRLPVKTTDRCKIVTETRYRGWRQHGVAKQLARWCAQWSWRRSLLPNDQPPSLGSRRGPTSAPTSSATESRRIKLLRPNFRSFIAQHTFCLLFWLNSSWWVVSPTTSQYTPLVPIQHTNIVMVWRRNARELINTKRNSTLQLSSTSGHQDHPAVWRRPTIQETPQDITSGRLFVMCVHTAKCLGRQSHRILRKYLLPLRHIRSSITDTNQTLNELCTRGIAAQKVCETAQPPPSRLANMWSKTSPWSHTRQFAVSWQPSHFEPPLVEAGARAVDETSAQLENLVQHWSGLGAEAHAETPKFLGDRCTATRERRTRKSTPRGFQKNAENAEVETKVAEIVYESGHWQCFGRGTSCDLAKACPN